MAIFSNGLLSLPIYFMFFIFINGVTDAQSSELSTNRPLKADEFSLFFPYHNVLGQQQFVSMRLPIPPASPLMHPPHNTVSPAYIGPVSRSPPYPYRNHFYITNRQPFQLLDTSYYYPFQNPYFKPLPSKVDSVSQNTDLASRMSMIYPKYTSTDFVPSEFKNLGANKPYAYSGMIYPTHRIPYPYNIQHIFGASNANRHIYNRGGFPERNHGYVAITESDGQMKTEVAHTLPEESRGFLTNLEKNLDLKHNNRVTNFLPQYTIKITTEIQNTSNIVPANVSGTSGAKNSYTSIIKRVITFERSNTDTQITQMPITTTPSNDEDNVTKATTQMPITVTPPNDVENVTIIDGKIVQKGRRFMDVPTSCPKGTHMAHNGKCIAPFVLAGLDINAETDDSKLIPNQNEDYKDIPIPDMV